jgi:valyl-tRNA synthetase
MIEKYGADAVRLSLLLLTREGQDVKLSEDRFEMGKRFTNKTWNAARFVLGHLGGALADVSAPISPATLEDRWILSRLAHVRDEVTEALDAYRFNDAASALYRFVWNDFCDWYLELSKSRLSAEGDPTRPAARWTLFRVLHDTLRLLHPFTPFQTEVLWRGLHEALGLMPETLLVRAPWPERGASALRDEAAEREMGVLQELVRAVRNVRALTMLGERKPLAAVVSAPRAFDREVLTTNAARACALAVLSSLEVHERAERPPASAVGVAAGFEVFIPLDQGVDLGELAATFARRAEKLEKALAAADAKLANEGFLRGAEPDVVEAERARRDETARELDLLRRNLAGLA